MLKAGADPANPSEKVDEAERGLGAAALDLGAMPGTRSGRSRSSPLDQVTRTPWVRHTPRAGWHGASGRRLRVEVLGWHALELEALLQLEEPLALAVGRHAWGPIGGEAEEPFILHAERKPRSLAQVRERAQ